MNRVKGHNSCPVVLCRQARDALALRSSKDNNKMAALLEEEVEVVLVGLGER